MRPEDGQWIWKPFLLVKAGGAPCMAESAGRRPQWGPSGSPDARAEPGLSWPVGGCAEWRGLAQVLPWSLQKGPTCPHLWCVPLASRTAGGRIHSCCFKPPSNGSPGYRCSGATELRVLNIHVISKLRFLVVVWKARCNPKEGPWTGELLHVEKPQGWPSHRPASQRASEMASFSSGPVVGLCLTLFSVGRPS